MKNFDELYGIMATSANVKYMRVFGDTMRCMMKDMADRHPELAQEYIEKLCAIKWKNYLTKKGIFVHHSENGSKGYLGYASMVQRNEKAQS